MYLHVTRDLPRPSITSWQGRRLMRSPLRLWRWNVHPESMTSHAKHLRRDCVGVMVVDFSMLLRLRLPYLEDVCRRDRRARRRDAASGTSGVHGWKRCREPLRRSVSDDDASSLCGGGGDGASRGVGGEGGAVRACSVGGDGGDVGGGRFSATPPSTASRSLMQLLDGRRRPAAAIATPTHHPPAYSESSIVGGECQRPMSAPPASRASRANAIGARRRRTERVGRRLVRSSRWPWP